MNKLFFGLLAFVLTVNSFGQANSKNPFDHAGRIHNEIVLEYLRLHKASVSTADLIQKVKSVSNANNSFINLKPENKTFPSVSFLENGVTDFKNNFKNVVANSGLTSEGKLEAQKFIDKMLTLAANENTTFQNVASEILRTEDLILANTRLTASDREALLMSTSVSRFSNDLWYNIYSKDSNETFARRGFWGWVAVVCGDAIGGLAGAGAFSVGTAISASSLANTIVKEVESNK